MNAVADVFISYKAEDRPHAQRLVGGLTAEGLSVWWDQDIAPDAPWEAAIEHELRHAKAAVVVWSPCAAASENVKSEARWAQRAGKLIQVFVVGCDPPLFFGERQGIDLTGWSGDPADPNFRKLVAAAKAVAAGKPPPQGVGYTPAAGRPGRIVAICAAAAALAGIGLALTFPHSALCHMAGRPGLCARDGSPPSPATVAAAAAEARRALIQSVAGAWDRQGGACKIPILIAARTDGAGVTTLTVSGRNGFRSLGQVITAEGNAVVVRDVEASAAAGSTTEYRPTGALMAVVDGRGVSTPLIRCPSASATSP